MFFASIVFSMSQNGSNSKGQAKVSTSNLKASTNNNNIDRQPTATTKAIKNENIPEKLKV